MKIDIKLFSTLLLLKSLIYVPGDNTDVTSLSGLGGALTCETIIT